MTRCGGSPLPTAAERLVERHQILRRRLAALRKLIFGAEKRGLRGQHIEPGDEASAILTFGNRFLGLR